MESIKILRQNPEWLESARLLVPSKMESSRGSISGKYADLC